MPFWKCYYHIVWATKYRESSLTPALEQVVFAAIERKSDELGCVVLALNGTDNHVHLAVNIKPGLSVSQYIRIIKGVSSHTVNINRESETRFHWQEGYSVLTFGEKALPFVREYIANQKTHHANNTTNTHLEYIAE